MANIWIPYNLFELRDEEVIATKIITVNYATYAVAERKPEKIQACRGSNPYVCDTQDDYKAWSACQSASKGGLLPIHWAAILELYI